MATGRRRTRAERLMANQLLEGGKPAAAALFPVEKRRCQIGEGDERRGGVKQGLLLSCV